jgi:hypothetical protein
MTHKPNRTPMLRILKILGYQVRQDSQYVAVPALNLEMKLRSFQSAEKFFAGVLFGSWYEKKTTPRIDGEEAIRSAWDSLSMDSSHYIRVARKLKRALGDEFPEVMKNPRRGRKKKNPTYESRLIKMQEEAYGEGVTSSPTQGGFLMYNGEFLNMGAYGQRGDDHRMLESVLPRSKREKFQSRYDAMAYVAKKTNMYRWMPESWSLETWTAPSRAQLDTIEQLASMRPIAIEAWKGRSHYCNQYEEWDSERAWKDLYEFYRYGNKPS